MQSRRGKSRLPLTRQRQPPPPPPPLPPPTNNTNGERTKRQSIIPSTNNLAEGPDYIVRQADIPQILGFLRELGLHATEKDLTQPNPIRIRQLFELLLQYFVPHRIDFLQTQKQRAAMVAFQDSPELGVEVVEAVPIFKEMQFFLKKLRFTDIKLTDLLSPTPTRLQRILSALFNFSLFRDSAYEQFRSMTEGAISATAQHESLVAETKLLRAKISELESQTELERTEVEKWEAKIQEGQQELKQLRKEGDTIVKDIQSCKNERHQLKDCLQELQYTTLNAINYVEQLKQYETLDLDVINKEIGELAIAMEKNTEEMNELEQNIPQLEEMIAEMKSLNNNLSKWIQTMDAINNIRADSSRHKKTNEALKKEQFSAKLLQKELASKLSNVSRSLAVQDNRLQLLMDQREKKRETMDKYFTDLDKKKVIVDQEVEAALHETNKCNLQIKEVQDKCNAAFAEHKSSMEALRSHIQRIFDSINDTHAKSMKYT